MQLEFVDIFFWQSKTEDITTQDIPFIFVLGLLGVASWIVGSIMWLGSLDEPRVLIKKRGK
jgi:hypothetical protein